MGGIGLHHHGELGLARVHLPHQPGHAHRLAHQPAGGGGALGLLGQAPEDLWPLTDGKRKISYEERIRPLREAVASKLL